MVLHRPVELAVVFGPIAQTVLRASRVTLCPFCNFFRDKVKTRSLENRKGASHKAFLRELCRPPPNNYTEEEIYEMTTTVTTVVVLAISFFLKRHRHIDSGDKIQALLETYGPVADGTKAVTK